MTTNLKRKRVEGAGSRKNPKLADRHEEPDWDARSSKDGGNSSAGESDGEDEEEWRGIGEPASTSAEVHDRQHSGTKPKKPPTGEELRVIKDAAELFRSSSFKLQIDALLPNVRPKTSRIPPLDRFLLALHATIMGILPVPPQHPLEAARKLLKKSVSVPYVLPLPLEETNWKVAFEKPAEIVLVGSWANKVSVKGKDGTKFGVDLAVEMPNSLFQEKDYLNARFFQKRAFYLATIASAIKSSKNGLDAQVSYQSLSNDTRLTKLVVTHKTDNSSNDFTKLHAEVCIIPILSTQSPISLHRLSPTHSNLRVSSNSEDESKSAPTPTPLYNHAFLTAMTPRIHLLATHTLKNEAPAFSDALALIRVWANQRGYSGGSRMCVRGFEAMGPWWSALLAFLVLGEEPRVAGNKASRRKALGRGLSSYQLFRAALDFLSKHDFEETPIFVKSGSGHQFPPDEYDQKNGPIFVDSSSTVNLLAGVPHGSLDLLRYDALKTLEALDHPPAGSDAFTDVFLKDHRDLSTRFDIVIRVDLSNANPRNTSVHAALDAGSPSNALISSIGSLTRQALGNRCKAVATLQPPSETRELSQAHPSSPEVIFIGLIHHPEHAFRLVDHGPAADETDPTIRQRFTELWGDKAELRRFKDGRIVESVVWDVKTIDERAHVPGMIARHILNHHFGISDASIQTWQTSFDSVLRLPESISKLYSTSGVAAGFKAAISAFDTVVKSIKSLDEELPLALLSVSPASEMLRYTSVLSPTPLPASLAPLMPANARYMSPIEIILEFEKSSKWPDDLRAIQKIKLAFFERIATALMAAIGGLSARVVTGDGVSTSEVLDKSYLEIVTPEGWAFNARIWHDREATLLDRIIDNTAGVLPHVTKPREQKKGRDFYDAVEARMAYTRRFIHGPRHHRAIAALCHHYSAFSGTVRLVKRWLASHWLLQGHISEDLIEIICASLFIGDGKVISAGDDAPEDKRANVPGSKERGFALVVEFLKEWKWEETLFVPLYGGEEAAPVSKIPPTSTAGSNVGVWKVATELDGTGRFWTSHGPDFVVAQRVKALAHATWECLQSMAQGQLDVRAIFTHPTDDYDFVIRLDSKILPRYSQNVVLDTTLLSNHGKYANLPEATDNSAVRPGLDPAGQLFNDLQRIYLDTFKIFYDPFGGDCFGGVWDPSLNKPRPFRVLGKFNSIPCKKENDKAKETGQVALNKGAILSEIERLGVGLIKALVIHESG
ncbi:Nrap protein [Infundibulicybe gibba]|nr:Nrap protein [Infundibulicybe gibba]